MVFISHKLREVLSVAERIAVMRRGKLVAEVKPAETTADALANLMVGEARPAAGDGGALPPAHGRGGAGRPGDLKARGERRARRRCNGVTLDVHAGEIVGIAGVDGNGQRELAEVLTGLRALDGGEGTLLGKPLTGLTPAEARRRGVGHVPEDRLRRAVVKGMSVEENVALGRQGQPPFARGPWLDFRAGASAPQKLLDAYDVRPPDPLLPRRRRSRAATSRRWWWRASWTPRRSCWWWCSPRAAWTSARWPQVHARLREERARGCGVLLVSLDLEEVLALSDRIYVLFEGRVTGTFTRARVRRARDWPAHAGTREPSHG